VDAPHLDTISYRNAAILHYFVARKIKWQLSEVIPSGYGRKHSKRGQPFAGEGNLASATIALAKGQKIRFLFSYSRLWHHNNEVTINSDWTSPLSTLTSDKGQS
ncbi:hypothetical protein, partial [Brucella sp. BO2]|uniref:hypothetical protein n=1 Tax=Brucella sp. BO2 TaxID=693750 RepID=UPI000A021926